MTYRCVDKDSPNWEAQLLDTSEDELDDIDETAIEIEEEPTPPSITSYRNAILAMEDVSEFLSSQGHIEAHSVVC